MIEANQETFDQEVLQSATPVLVDFWAPWCGPCVSAAPIVEQLSQDFEGRAKVVKVNCDDCMELANSHGVRGIPAFLIFKGGKKVAEHSGMDADLAKKLTTALTAALGE